MSERFSISKRIQSFAYAFRGIWLVFRDEHNAWIHAVATVAVIAVGLWLEVSASGWCWLTLAMMAVWSGEAVNTAVERLADAARPDPHPLVRDAKDAAAGAVLISAIGAGVIGLLVLGPPLLERLAGGG